MDPEPTLILENHQTATMWRFHCSTKTLLAAVQLASLVSHVYSWKVKDESHPSKEVKLVPLVCFAVRQNKSPQNPRCRIPCRNKKQQYGPGAFIWMPPENSIRHTKNPRGTQGNINKSATERERKESNQLLLHHDFHAINSSFTNCIPDTIITDLTFLQFTHHSSDRHC